MEMNNLTKRLAIAKLIWLAFWIIGFILLPILFNEQDIYIRLWVLFWYITFGAIIWMVWIMDEHPYLKFKMPFFIRWLMLWAWMNLVLFLFISDSLTNMVSEWSLFEWMSPLWFIVEWALIWLIIDYFWTKFAWEWKDLIK